MASMSHRSHTFNFLNQGLLSEKNYASLNYALQTQDFQFVPHVEAMFESSCGHIYDIAVILCRLCHTQQSSCLLQDTILGRLSP